MRKKIISLIMAIVLSASLALFPACEFIDSTLNNEQSSSQTSEDSSSESTSSSSENGCEEHTYGEWETVTEASCVAGEKQRVCENCNEIETEEIPALDDFTAHIFNPDTLCTTCGHQEFIESEEYIEQVTDYDFSLYSYYIWWNTDRTYALKIGNSYPITGISYDVEGYLGTPIDIVLPARFNAVPIKRIGGTIGISMDNPAYAFKNCSTLESIIIPEGIETIWRASFENCTSLKFISLPNSLLGIDVEAFYNCSSLTEIYLPKNINSVPFVFYNCTSLKKIYIHKDCSISTDVLSAHPYIEFIRYE